MIPDKETYCYLPFSYKHIQKNGLTYGLCEVKNGIAFFKEVSDEQQFYAKTVNEIIYNKELDINLEVYPYQKDLDNYNKP